MSREINGTSRLLFLKKKNKSILNFTRQRTTKTENTVESARPMKKQWEIAADFHESTGLPSPGTKRRISVGSPCRVSVNKTPPSVRIRLGEADKRGARFIQGDSAWRSEPKLFFLSFNAVFRAGRLSVVRMGARRVSKRSADA